jgi:hypothetical protein
MLLPGRFFIMRFKNIRIVLMLIAVVVGINITASVYAKRSNEDVKKDSNKIYGELKQPSIYVIEDQYIYYISLSDWGIYSIQLDSGSRKQIYSGRVCEEGILICGDFIYFKSKNDNKLYRIKKNDTVPEKVSDNELGRQYQGFLSINDEIIYYDLNDQPNNTENTGISNDKKEFYKKIELSSIFNHGILYNCSNEGLKSYNVEDKKERKLVGSNVFRIVSVDDRYIYYINNDYKLYKISIYGKEDVLVLKDRVVDPGVDFDFGNVEFVDDHIYYISYEMPEKSTLYRFCADGSNKEKIKDNVLDFRLSQKGIYYISSSDGKKLHFLGFDCLKDNVIDEGAAAYIAGVQNNYLVYSAESDNCSDIYGQLFLTDGRGKKFELK